jgi:hypothetical protein
MSGRKQTSIAERLDPIQQEDVEVAGEGSMLKPVIQYHAAGLEHRHSQLASIAASPRNDHGNPIAQTGEHHRLVADLRRAGERPISPRHDARAAIVRAAVTAADNHRAGAAAREQPGHHGHHGRLAGASGRQVPHAEHRHGQVVRREDSSFVQKVAQRHRAAVKGRKRSEPGHEMLSAGHRRLRHPGDTSR